MRRVWWDLVREWLPKSWTPCSTTSDICLAVADSRMSTALNVKHLQLGLHVKGLLLTCIKGGFTSVWKKDDWPACKLYQAQTNSNCIIKKSTIQNSCCSLTSLLIPKTFSLSSGTTLNKCLVYLLLTYTLLTTICSNSLWHFTQRTHVYAVSLPLNKGWQQVHRVEFRLDKVASYDLKPGGTSV